MNIMQLGYWVPHGIIAGQGGAGQEVTIKLIGATNLA